MPELPFPLEHTKSLFSTAPSTRKRCRICTMVPHFLGILIHSGNTEVDSAGCIIVGNNTVRGKVLESLATFQNLYSILESEVDITIQIV